MWVVKNAMDGAFGMYSREEWCTCLIWWGSLRDFGRSRSRWEGIIKIDPKICRDVMGFI